MLKFDNELFSVFLDGEFQGYVNSEDYEQIGAAICLLGGKGDLIFTSLLNQTVIATVGIFIDYCLPEIRESLMKELLLFQIGHKEPELALIGNIQFHAAIS